MDAEALRPRGAYGLRLSDLAGAADVLVTAPESWAHWRISREVGGGEADREDFVGERSASVPLWPAGRLDVDRSRALATIAMPAPPSDTALAHPYLAPIAAIVARWLRHSAFHSGAVIVGDGAWAILGGSGSGKSSLIASLAELGSGVLADDLLVVARGRVLAGPLCVDLREDAARALGRGTPLDVGGGRERWRVPVAPAPAELPLRGFVTLAWSEAVRVRPVPVAGRLPRLFESLAMAAAPTNPDALVDLATLPMVALERPRRYETLRESSARLLDALA